jgi:plastocyanin
MRRMSVAVGLVVLLSVMIAACDGNAGSAGATIGLGSSSFTGTTNVTIKAGESVTFDDSSGGTHHLVPGDKKTVTFPTAGTYQITCTIHPSMQATITVTAG